jgi:hypothetical protein
MNETDVIDVADGTWSWSRLATFRTAAAAAEMGH